jgi:hypothetical protein
MARPSPARRVLALAATLAALTGVALVARQAPPPQAEMTAAAAKFLASLDPEQKQAAAFAFDDPHRMKWYFTPQQVKGQSQRKGLRMDKMTPAQRDAALALVKTGLSVSGTSQVETIRSLENVLKALEKNGVNTRNPDWYFVSVFGDPAATGRWGWRFEGHHLSVNFTLDNGTVVAATPLVFAANPAEVRTGPEKGLIALPEVASLAQTLIDSFTPEQKKLAEKTNQFPEIKEGQPEAAVGAPVGIPAEQLNAEQSKTLKKLIQVYANRLTPLLAAAELKRVKDAGADNVRFAYCVQPTKPGEPYSYRIQGPTFVVEFLNVQADSAGNPANHYHTGWRRLPIDFGLATKK